MNDSSRSGWSMFTVLFLAWATYLIVKGISGDGTGQTSDAAAATYLVGGVVTAALALLPWRQLRSSRSGELRGRSHRGGGSLRWINPPVRRRR